MGTPSPSHTLAYSFISGYVAATAAHQPTVASALGLFWGWPAGFGSNENIINSTELLTPSHVPAIYLPYPCRLISVGISLPCALSTPFPHSAVYFHYSLVYCCCCCLPLPIYYPSSLAYAVGPLLCWSVGRPKGRVRAVSEGVGGRMGRRVGSGRRSGCWAQTGNGLSISECISRIQDFQWRNLSTDLTPLDTRHSG